MSVHIAMVSRDEIIRKVRYIPKISSGRAAVRIKIKFSDGSEEEFHQHENGGGLVSYRAQIDRSAYLGTFALVWGGARILGNARVEGYAWVFSGASVEEEAVVTDLAIVCTGSRIAGKATIRDCATVAGRSIVEGSATIGGEAWVDGAAHVRRGAHYRKPIFGTGERVLMPKSL